MKEQGVKSYQEFRVLQPVKDMMVRQRIIDPDEEPQHMLKRVVETLFTPETNFGTPPAVIEGLKEEFAQYMAAGYVLPGTPTLTNAGRNMEAALSSCVIIPVDLNDKDASAKRIRAYYLQNMGSGFDFTPYKDPVGLLRWINDLSAQETATGRYDRYIGNMGSVHVSHPKIEEFIDAKQKDGILPHFNISVDLSEEFMCAVENGREFVLADGKKIDASELFHKMSHHAWTTGDPGILFLDRMNHDNPLASSARYVSTPPCGEMGLAEGETCQFAYLNLARFTASGSVDWTKLAQVTQLTTRALDNAIEYSIDRFPASPSAQMAALKRKIGIGVCGLADVLIAFGIPYDSPAARVLARDILSFVNFASKEASVKLADARGSCKAMWDRINNRYYKDFLERKYGRNPTNTVTAQQWESLSEDIKTTGHLRNILTTALPPTGRASVILGVTPSIEPIFSVFDGKEVKKPVRDFVCQVDPLNAQRWIDIVQVTGTFQHDEVPQGVRSVLKTAKEIAPYDHLAMVAALAGTQGVVDEAASKTVNLPNGASVDDVEKIFSLAHSMGLKNISVYRDKSKAGQPEQL